MLSSSVPAKQQQLHVLVSRDVQPLNGFTAVYNCMLHVSLDHCRNVFRYPMCLLFITLHMARLHLTDQQDST